MDYIITRDEAAFAMSQAPAISAAEFVQIVEG